MANSIQDELEAAIRTIPDYPKKGILFRDVTTLLGDAKASVDSIAKALQIREELLQRHPDDLLRNDEIETPESYRAELDELRRRGMFMLCGNPDLVVERGEKLVYCAGALADLVDRKRVILVTQVVLVAAQPCSCHPLAH